MVLFYKNIDRRKFVGTRDVPIVSVISAISVSIGIDSVKNKSIGIGIGIDIKNLGVSASKLVSVHH